MAKAKLLSESALEKKYKHSARASVLLPTDKFIFLPSRSLALNWQLGGGLLYGRITELFGYESTGKSLLAMDFGVAAQKLGGVVLWGDAEGTFNPTWALQNGLDPEKVIVYDSNDIEGYSDWHRDQIIHWRSKLTKNEPILLICDSIAALDCLDNMNGSQLDAKAEMGNRAKAIYKMYRFRNHFYKQMGVCVLMINQVRKKVGAGMFEAAETTPGGDSTRFYATQRLGLVPGKQLKGKVVNGKFELRDDGRKCGRFIYCQIAKNKIGPPRDSVKTQVYFLPDPWGYVGYSRYHGLLEILEYEKVIKVKKGSITYKDKLIARGEESFIKLLHNDEEIRKRLIRRSSINTTSKTREKLDSISENLFPIKLKESDGEE
jgi:recombination protein RecA